jgi:large subunit ribosomal protein L30
MEQEKPTAEKPKSEATGSNGKVAVLLVRNTTGASGAVRDTLKMLRLHKKFTCTIFDKTEAMMGMLAKTKDYTTYGEIDDETLKLLTEKRGKTDPEGKPRKDFHLSPPKGGFERKGIKQGFSQGGVLGYRGSKINELIKKML